VIDASYRTLMILHLALMMSLGVYFFVLYTVVQNNPPAPLEPVMFYALTAVAVMIMLMIPVLRGKLLPPMREAASLDETVPQNDATQQAVARVLTTSLLSWALCESIATFGLMLSFMSRDLKYFYGFAAVSLVNFAIYRPNKELLLGAARAAQ
jgi:hypothetical protein